MKKIRQILDRQEIDDSTKNALKAARNRVLDSQARQPLLAWKPVVTFASLALVVGGLLVYELDTDTGFPATNAEDLAVIGSEDEFEFYEELEFYLWLDEDHKV